MVRLLHTNDFHGVMGETKREALRELRSLADLYFDSGDCIKSGNLAVPIRPESIWSDLERLGCNACTLGNRESHVLGPAFRAKIAGASQPLLAANLRDKAGDLVVQPAYRTSVNGVRISVIGLMVPMVTKRMKTAAASSYLWDDPIMVGVELAELERPHCDLLIALTHIGLTRDRDLAEATDHYDLILGGHSHSVIEPPLHIGRTYICQGGSHGRYAGMYQWDPKERRLHGRLLSLP